MISVEVAQQPADCNEIIDLTHKTTALEEFGETCRVIDLIAGEAARAWETMSVPNRDTLERCSGESCGDQILVPIFARGIRHARWHVAILPDATSVTSGIYRKERRCARLLILSITREFGGSASVLFDPMLATGTAPARQRQF